jgi:NAD(P)-dependent dehydrogenase (short-subunit alcohol dehydrogenase family)
MRLDGKIAWVVGGSAGIGAAVARELERRGATVAISARRQEQLQAVAEGNMLVVPADVTDAAAMAAAAERIRQDLGPIDLAVLSAGYWKQMSPGDWDTGVFDQHLRVNLTGMSNSIAAVLPDMLRRHHGLIAGIASVAGYRGLAGAEAYGATKAGQINLLESLRVHTARTGVRVTTICPGFVRTDLTADNPFAMPFMIEADQAARAICDGLERDRTEIVFPAPMALLMKTARFVPARAWTALWARTSPGRPGDRPPATSAGTKEPKDTMRLRETVTVDKPLDAVFSYLSDFTNTTEWDPGTVATVNQHGDGGVGTTYLNTSTFLGRETQLTYIVRELEPGRRIQLRGENKTLVAVDTMTFRSVNAGTEVTYTAEFTFKGPSRLVAPLLRPAFVRLGKQAQTGMREALNQRL